MARVTTGGWSDKVAPTKRTNPKVMKKANLAVRIQPACPVWF